MRAVTLLFVILLLGSCKNNSDYEAEQDSSLKVIESPSKEKELLSATQNPDFNDKVLSILVNEKARIPIEFPEIYDSLSSNYMIADSLERLIIVEKLKRQGFSIINWGRGNFPGGPRIVYIDLLKEDCACRVSKKYYSSSVSANQWKMTETISCTDTSSYFNK